MFERYSFENPRDDSRYVDVGVWSYVAAGLMGSIYVLWKAGIAGFCRFRRSRPGVTG